MKKIALSLAAICAMSFCIYLIVKENKPVSIEHKTKILDKNTVASDVQMPETASIDPLSNSVKNDVKSAQNTSKSRKKDNIDRDNDGDIADTDSENESNDPDDFPVMAGVKKLSHQQRINEAIALEIERTKDPALGYVPIERLNASVEQTRRQQNELLAQSQLLRGSIASARWLERGPSNVGGRTRAILVDKNDPSGKTVFAGSTIGGLFRTPDITAADPKWERVADWLDNLTISSMAQDPRNPNILYIGSGDSDAGDTRGLAMFKSIDGGVTWRVIPTTLDGRFKSVAALVITADSSHIFAGTDAGLLKSKDGGGTWEKVLGAGVSGGQSDRVWTIQQSKTKGLIYVSTNGRVYKSTQNGALNTWVSASGTGFPTNLARCEVAVAPSDANILYAYGSISGSASNVYKSVNGGDTWTQRNSAAWIDGCSGTPQTGDVSRGQAWYDLAIIVDPLDPNIVWMGGVDLFRTLDGGSSWTQASFWAGCGGNKKYAHADQHTLYYDPTNPSVLYNGNDGGVFRISASNGSFQIADKNKGFVTTLFYGCAIHPDSAVNHFLAGAQDNGTNLIKGSVGVGTAVEVVGGDGFLSFIDQTAPQFQIGSLYGGAWYLSRDNGTSFGSLASSNGGFFTPADYDNKNHILFAQTRSTDLWRYNIITSTATNLDLSGVRTSNVSLVFCDENVDGRVYVGTATGQLYRCNGMTTGSIIADVVQVGAFQGNVSSVDVERGNPNHILVTMSSWGVVNVKESTNGGTSWADLDANLPDMPVRWCMFNPNNGQQALLATELGVWGTELLNGASTVWLPPTPGKGTPLVRTDRLEWRKSDNMVLAGTYGRGLWTTAAFGKAAVGMQFPQVTYLNVPVNFRGETSVSADKFKWTFSDGVTDTMENIQRRFQNVGKYDVSLMINNNNALKLTNKIQVLPSLPTPYKAGTTNYAGGFESTVSDVDFGIWNVAGSKFERGVSSFPGKSGTHAGQNAMVLGRTENFYQKNTIAYLYTPNFDMTKTGIYQFSFWSAFDIQNGYDGFKVEYSLDKGITWQQLGTKDDANPNWYNYQNTSLTGAAFLNGEAYFTGKSDDWERFKINISDFAGNENVAFRFAFKSDGDNVLAIGLAIDDVEVSRYEGKLQTAIVAQSGAYTRDGTSIDVTFKTQPEYFAKTFDLEKSVNGRTWELVETFRAKSGSTEELQEYTTNVRGTPLDLYYFRIKSVNQDTRTNYNFSFYNKPFTVRRGKEVPLTTNAVFPSPFVNYIGITFTDVVDTDVEFNLYDDIGRLVKTEKVIPNAVYYEIKTGVIAKGIYLLTVKIGDNKPETTKLFGGTL